MPQRASNIAVAGTIGLVGAGGSFAARAFVPALSGMSAGGQPAALRGGIDSHSASPPLEDHAAGWFHFTGISGAIAVTALASRDVLASRGAAASRAPRRATAAAEPPKPPPFEPAKQVGAMDPLGYWDPAGFTKKGDEAGFRNLRAAEIKHGRVAMMAAVGAVAQHFVKFPGFEGVPAGVQALLTPPGSYGFILLFVLAGGLELGVWTESPEKEPGNFGDPVGFGAYDTEMRNRELNNGRFAMFAAIGIIAAELLTGKDAVQQFG